VQNILKKWWVVPDYSGLRIAAMFKFALGELVEPTTIGLKDSYLIYQVFIDQSQA
jgi:hypothetical protein